MTRNDVMCKPRIGAIRRIKPFVQMHTSESINKSLVKPYFDNRSSLWDTCLDKIT